MSEGAADVYVKFEGIIGECTDEKHPGTAGWFQVSRFDFNFGVKDEEGPAANAARPARRRGGTVERRVAELEQQNERLTEAVNRAGTQTGARAGAQEDGAHNHPDVTLTKNLNVASHRIWRQHCYEGRVINMVTFEACRTGGLATAEKIPFVRLVFEGVYIKSVSMDVPEDALPSETVTFSYERVRMESIWTDNETGERCVDRPRRFGWDFQNNLQWTGEGG